MSKKLIRLFVSSTFTDFKDERDALNKEVFPRVAAYCAQRGFMFQAVDLRWGISESAAMERDTINICLEEIERCKQASPKPNFLLLVGNRYGWQPLPDSIESGEFKRLQTALSRNAAYSASFPLLQDWYEEDLNAVPAEYILKNRRDITGAGREAVDNMLMAMLRAGAESADLPDEDKEKYYLSATGYEIAKGALQTEKNGQSYEILCFFREIDEIENHVDVDSEKSRWLERLKSRLQGRFPQYSYSVHINKRGGDAGCLDDFCTQAEAMLRQAVDRRISEAGAAANPAALEAAIHQDFMNSRAEGFCGREDILAEAAAYALNPLGRPMLLYGARGVGKSSVAAKIASQLEKQSGAETCLVYRFVGASAQSSDSFSLLCGMLAQIHAFYGRPFVAPGAYADACSKWRNALALSGKERPLCIVIDAVDQLVTFTGDDPLLWLRNTLPPHTALILLTRDGAFADYTAERLKNPMKIEIPRLNAAHAREILSYWLASRRRTLTKAQFEYIIERFSRVGLPIYLRLAFEQARYWRSFTVPVLSESVNGIIKDYLDWLSRDSKHGSELVKKVFAIIYCAKDGVSEAELMAILSADEEVMKDFRRRSPNSPGTESLPFMVWSRLHYEIEPYLKETDIDGQALLGFYHLQIRDTVEVSLLTDVLIADAHKLLKRCFEKAPLYHDENKDFVNLRKLTELPYHIMRTKNVSEIKALLDDESYLQAKVGAGRLAQLTDELYWLLTAVPDQTFHNEKARGLFKFVIRYNWERSQKGASGISLEDLHSLLIYRDNRSFHEKVFKLGESASSIRELCPETDEAFAEEMSRICVTRLINYYRRIGALTEAERLIEKVSETLKGGNEKDYARVLYDLGYVRYMQSEYAAAIEAMERSAAISEKTGDPAGMWISRCVASRISTISALNRSDREKTLRDSLNVFTAALEVFERHSDNNMNAKRWIFNVKQHCLINYVWLGDVKEAQRFYLECVNDPRAADDKTGLLGFYRSLIEGLEGRYADAIASMKPFVNYRAETSVLEGSRAEALAECYFLSGKWALALGHTDEAGRQWRAGLALSDEPGNHHWRNEIAAAMKKAGIRP